ncbi:MAG: hypothetical protein C0608_09980 [Deltaproteobacteria bacterium]|nr:MAG: hypothetical protein C0608_09980 [Deltaproteobacteria bacterium]
MMASEISSWGALIVTISNFREGKRALIWPIIGSGKAYSIMVRLCLALHQRESVDIAAEFKSHCPAAFSPKRSLAL